jgi:glycosyltransferase involved in cell wall biosynthesis
LGKEKRQILLVCNDGDYFLRHRLFVVNRLAEIGVDVTVLVGGKPIPEQLIGAWKYSHVDIERFRFSIPKDVGLAMRTARSLWKIRPDAVHLVTLKPAVFSGIVAVVFRLLFGYPRRILITLPGLGRMLSPSTDGKHQYRLASSLTLSILWLLGRNSGVHFTFETKHDRDFFASNGIVNPANSFVIDGAGVDPTVFYPPAAPRRNLRKRILFASRPLKAKGLYAFLMAAHHFADRPKVEFLVASIIDDSDPSAVPSEYLKGLLEIGFLGQVDDMPSLLRECDIVCLPTRYGEGIPRILIEAAASGAAAIASDHPGCREVVRDGSTGQIVAGDSDEELSSQLCAAIAKYLNEPQLLERHQQAAYQFFLSRGFSQTAISKRFCELLEVDFEGQAT